MTGTLIRILLAGLAVCIFAAGVWNSAAAQKGGDNFSHSVAAHKKIACNSCHKIPTANWSSARGFPDVADYPGHASCINCHRSDFFRGNRPAICTICHVAVGPRGKARFAFPVKSRSQEFATIFPHDVHQDIIASHERKNNPVAVAHFVRAGFRAFDDERPPQFNNCAICHATETKLPKYAAFKPLRTEPLAAPAAENFTPKPQFFKGMPDNHASCFNCHYQGVKPARTDCAGCHRLTSPYFESNVVRRYSLKFDHASENHANKDCTVCHIRITQTSDLRKLVNADVPLLTCSSSSCHSKQIFEEIGKREKSVNEKQTIFQCTYCHSSEIGSFKIPASHLEQAK